MNFFPWHSSNLIASAYFCSRSVSLTRYIPLSVSSSLTISMHFLRGICSALLQSLLFYIPDAAAMHSAGIFHFSMKDDLMLVEVKRQGNGEDWTRTCVILVRSASPCRLCLVHQASLWTSFIYSYLHIHIFIYIYTYIHIHICLCTQTMRQAGWLI